MPTSDSQPPTAAGTEPTDVDEKRCEQAGLDPAKVLRVARRLSRAARDARAMGLVVFGGSGAGSLRIIGDDSWSTDSVVAWLGQGFDGGDGGDR